MDNGKLKTIAKERLTGNYLVLIFSILLFIALWGCCNFIAYLVDATWISSILMLIVESLIAMGFVEMILKVARKKKITFDNLFDGIDLFGKYIILTLVLGAIGLLMCLMEFLAFKSLLMVIAYQTEINEILAVVLIIIGLFLSAGIIMVSLYISITLSQTYFILADEPESKTSEILVKSFDMMDNYILEYFMLVISFIGWIALGILTLGILYIWIIPYMLVTFAIFYDKVKKNYYETTGDIKELENLETVITVEAKTEVKKAAPKKTTKKQTTKSTAKKTTTKKVAEKAPAKKTATKKVAEKAPAKKTATKKTVTKKATSKTTK